MEGDVKVSVIVPVYQVECYLERAVDSLLEQTLEELEILLIDDGSTDASPALCDRYARDWPGKVRVVHQENQGLGMARNAGLDLARGEYIAFVDSDDRVDREMYQALYEKAQEGNYPLVCCDVEIHYVEEGRQSVSVTYPRRDLELGDYLLRGNNITYSVNKLYHRSLWQGLRYDKMVFEDIALIPALVTRTPSLGYVPKAFYHYYRRGNTLSTSQVGAMGDVVEAFRLFLRRADPAYREEAVYCAARQLYWNMTQARSVFLPDFIGLLQAFSQEFLWNRYLREDGKLRELLGYLDRQVIPRRFVTAHWRRALPPGWRQCVEENFPGCQVVELTERDLGDSLPPGAAQALSRGDGAYLEDYLTLRELCRRGGVALSPESRPKLGLNRLRLHGAFFAFGGEEDLDLHCYGALPEHPVLQALLQSYEEPAPRPLSRRLGDLLQLGLGFAPNGRRQSLERGVEIYPANVLSYDMQDGENLCRREAVPLPPGLEAVAVPLLARWSRERMANWNLYKRERERKGAPPPEQAPAPAGVSQAALDQELRRLAEVYENSTSWKVTRPLRALGQLWKGGRV